MALRAAAAASAALLTRPWVSPVHAQDDEPFDPGGRVHVDYDETVSFNELLGYPPMLGRVESRILRVLSHPDVRRYDVVDNVFYDQVLPIYEVGHFPDSRWSSAHNDLWFNIGTGYIHSAWVVPCKEVFNQPEDVPAGGFWGEITVPTSWQHYEPKLRSRRFFDMAYGAVFRVIDRADEPDGRAWYRLLNDIAPDVQHWVQAIHVRRILRHEFSPISPTVPPEDKRIEVDLTRQVVTCYERDMPVFSTRCATGASFIDAEGVQHDFFTPPGSYRVLFKRPSRRMQGGSTPKDAYDLPGVPWCTFITGDGVAIHGTYWHNDYGHPRSHGCINVTIDAARWIFRWVHPFSRYDEEEHRTTPDEQATATRVVVAY